MRTTITIILTILIQLAWGQQKQVEYLHLEMYESARLVLLVDNKFSWKRTNCLGEQLVTGNYVLTDKKLVLSPIKEYIFFGTEYSDLINQGVMEDCCNIRLDLSKAKNYSDTISIHNKLYSDVDSCVINNMNCIVNSDKLESRRKKMGFKTNFTWTDFLVRGDKLTLLDGDKKTNWTLTRSK